jgi:hypothetical protein
MRNVENENEKRKKLRKIMNVIVEQKNYEKQDMARHKIVQERKK